MAPQHVDSDLDGDARIHAADVTAALRRIHRDLTDTQRIVYDRDLDVEPAPPARLLAKKRGVSPQSVQKIRRELRHRIEDSTGAALDALAGVVVSGLGDIVAVGGVQQAVTEWFPSGHKHCALARRMLASRIGYRTETEFELSPRATEALIACLHAADHGDVDGVLKAARFANGDDATANMLMAASGVEVLCGRLWRRGTDPARIAEVFDQQGSPLTTAQIIEATGLGEKRARTALHDKTRFGRAGYRLWMLAGDTNVEYSSIGEAIRRLVIDGGGSANQETVVASLVEAYGVTESSVRKTMRAPAFNCDAEEVSLAALGPQPVAGGQARFRFECDPKYLRGFSVNVSSEFAVVLGVGPGGHAMIPVAEPSGVPDVSLIWHATSHVRPFLGRIREPLTVINAQPGDMVAVFASDGVIRFSTASAGTDTPAGIRRRPPTKTCAYTKCSKTFQPVTDSSRYCSQLCRSRADWETRKPRYKGRVGHKAVFDQATAKVCGNDQCNVEFQPKTNQKTCSDECRKAHATQQRKHGPLRCCVACASYYRERQGHKGCCSPECYQTIAPAMNMDLLSQGCTLAVLVLLIDESRGGSYATSESISARLSVSRGNALKHLGALERAGLATRVVPTPDDSGGAPHEFRATIRNSDLAELAPAVTVETVEKLNATKTQPPQLGTDLWILAALTRMLPDGDGIVRRADLAAATGRHTATVSRSMQRLQTAGLLNYEPVSSVTVSAGGVGGGLRINLRTIHRNQLPRYALVPETGNVSR